MFFHISYFNTFVWLVSCLFFWTRKGKQTRLPIQSFWHLSLSVSYTKLEKLKEALFSEEPHSPHSPLHPIPQQVWKGILYLCPSPIATRVSTLNNFHEHRFHYHSVPHPDVFWYCLNNTGTQKNAPKKVLVPLFPYIFHVKTKWNIVYEYLKKNIFKRHEYPSPKALNIKYFSTLS